MNQAMFGTLPLKTLFLKLAVPNIISTIFIAITTTVDGIVVGNYIGSHALAAINIFFPVIRIVFALSDMIAVGSSVKIGIRMGEKREKEASQIFASSVLGIVLLGVFVMIFAHFFLEDILRFLIADSVLVADIFAYAQGFLYFIPLIIPYFAVDNYLRLCGKAKYSMCVSIIAAVLNIGLDILFVGILGWGIASASFATAISMMTGSILSIFPFLTKQLTLRFCKPNLPFREWMGIIYNGSSEFFNSISGSLISLLINALLLRLGGPVAVASYAILMYIDCILIYILFGLNDAMQPAVSYNYGAGQYDRIWGLFRLVGWTTAIISALFMLVIFIAPDMLVQIFSNGEEVAVQTLSKKALLYFSPSYLFVWFITITSSFLTGLEKPKQSIMLMTARAIVCPLIFLFVLTPHLGVHGVFLMPVCSGVLVCILALYFWSRSILPLRHLKPEKKMNRED